MMSPTDRDGSVLLGSFTAMFEHGILVVRDPDGVSMHDAWTGDTPVDVKPDSIWVAVMPYSPDLELVTVEVLEHADRSSNMVCCFDGQLRSTFGYVVVHDSDEFARLTLRIGRDDMGIRIEVDQPKEARYVRIVVDPK